VLALIWVAVLLARVEPAAAQSPSAPNILVIVTDDQRASDTLGVMPETRRLFLRKGIRYTNAFATTPLCGPSRSSILTGRLAHNTRVRTNGQGRRLDPSTVFTRLLQEANYQTGLAGKFLNGWPKDRTPPHFDRSAMLVENQGRYDNPTFNVNGSVKKVRGYSTRLVGRYATKFVRQFENQDSRPWVLYVAPMAPHYPWTPEARYTNARVGNWSGNPAVFERDRSDKPQFVRRLDYTLDDGQEARAGQLRSLKSVDNMVGRIFETLGRFRENGKTLAIFTSDNGVTWADHGIGGIGGTGAQKRLPYTASARIPLLLRWPGHLSGGASSPRLTGTIDLAPTVLDAAGVSSPPLDGRSLFDGDVRDQLLLEYWREGGTGFRNWASFRSRTLQYTEYYADDGQRRVFREYYGLGPDPWQLRNLFRDGKPLNDPDVSDLETALAEARTCSAGACP
jgi:arylsulfatase A-like enzyme